MMMINTGDLLPLIQKKAIDPPDEVVDLRWFAKDLESPPLLHLIQTPMTTLVLKERETNPANQIHYHLQLLIMYLKMTVLLWRCLNKCKIEGSLLPQLVLQLRLLLLNVKKLNHQRQFQQTRCINITTSKNIWIYIATSVTPLLMVYSNLLYNLLGFDILMLLPLMLQSEVLNIS